MTAEEQNPLKKEIEQELQSSQWLHKFKQLSEGLVKIQTEIPLTKLCQLKWITEDDSLVIQCPNSETRLGLVRQSEKLSNLHIGANKLIIRYSDERDFIVS
jgi:hypothetical protein